MLESYRERTEGKLQDFLPPLYDPPARLHEAMRYVALNGGKRVRASLTYATGEALGAPMHVLDAPACAVELIHAYSLVHDDLPCMDDDALRRGKPTCHVAYDEATALLVGDALQSLAFEVLATSDIADHGARVAMVQSLARASGSRGMAGGQAIDLQSVGKPLSEAELQDMHARKTGALIHCAVELGALAAGASVTNRRALGNFARAIGLAFQVADDILDVEGTAATLGKSAGKDARAAKPTYVSALGIAGAKEKARALLNEALESLAPLGDNGRPLADLARFIVERRQ